MSDIPTGPMSHNDPIRNILLDLIAELVGDDGDGHAITADGDDACRVCQMIDRAEARLREVQS